MNQQSHAIAIILNHTALWRIIYHCLKPLLDHMPSFPNHSESTEWKHHNISTTRPSDHQSV